MISRWAWFHVGGLWKSVQILSYMPSRGNPGSDGHVGKAGRHLLMIGLLSSVFSPPLAESQMDTQPDRNQILSGSFATGAPDEYARSEFLLVSWNIERGVRRSEILQALRGSLVADLYVLQEVDLHTRRADYRDVAAELARETGMNYVFGIEFEELAQGRKGLPAFHGQAVLSRYPISRARILRFRHQPYNWEHAWLPRWAWVQPRRGGRMALIAELQVGPQTVVVYDVHLESQAGDAGRAQQMDEILRDIHLHYSPDTPVIVAGDLNTKKGAESVVLGELKAAGFRDALADHKGPVFTKVLSNRRADWIFVRNLRFFGGEVSDLAISDHYPLKVCISTFVAATGPASAAPARAKP